MKNKIIVGLFTFVFSATSFAGDITRFDCVSGTKSGKILKLSFCHDDSNSLVACENEAESFVTVRRETPTLKGTMVESIQLPTDYFYLTREEESTQLVFGSDIGKLKLNYVSGEIQGGRWNVKIANFDHSFSAVRCDTK